jgi:DNA-binding NarL/FixJ family response regulator
MDNPRALCSYAAMPITVLLADDAESIRVSIKLLLEAEAGIKLVGEAASFAETFALCAELRPNVVLLDLHMPGEQFEAAYVKTKLLDCTNFVLAMSVWNDGQSRALADFYGARRFLDKAQLSSDLVPAIRAAAQLC